MPLSVSFTEDKLMIYSLRNFVAVCLFAALPFSVLGQTPPPAEPTPNSEPAQPMDPATPSVKVEGSGSVSAGGQNFTSFMTDAQESVYQMVGLPLESPTFGEHIDTYREFDSTPFLYQIGFPLGKILKSAYFSQLITFAWVLAMIIAASKNLNGREGVDYYSKIILKAGVGALVLASPPYIYAAARTVQDAGYTLVRAITVNAQENPTGVAQRTVELLKSDPARDPEIKNIKLQAIKRGLDERAGIFTRYATDQRVEDDLALLDFFATFFNEMGPAVLDSTKAAFSGERHFNSIPRVGSADVSRIRQACITAYTDLAIESGKTASGVASKASFGVNWSYKENSWSENIIQDSLSVRIDSVTKPILDEVAKLPANSEGQEAREKLLKQYEIEVSAATSNWVDTDILAHLERGMKGNSTLARIGNEISTFFDRARLFVGGISPTSFIDKVTGFVMKVCSVVRNAVIAPLVLVAIFLLNVILELSIMGLVASVPLWFIPGTAKAFTGSVETIITMSLILPFWQLMQLVLDLLLGFVATVLVAGGAAGVLTGTFAIQAGVGVIAAITMAQIVGSIILMIKAPKMLRGFLSGGSWVTSLLTATGAGIAASLVAATSAALVAVAPALVGGAGAAAGVGGAGAGAAGAAGSTAAAGGAGAATTSGSSALGSFVSRNGGMMKRAGADMLDSVMTLVSNDFDSGDLLKSKVKRHSRGYASTAKKAASNSQQTGGQQEVTEKT